MSNVAATTTNDNVTHCSSKQENNSHHHHHHHPYTHHHPHHQNRCLHEKCSNHQIVAHHHPHKNQNSNSSDSLIKRSAENNLNASTISCRQLGDSVSSCMRLDHIVDPIIVEGGLPGTIDLGITPSTQCHCLVNQHQQSSNHHLVNKGQPTAATTTNQGNPNSKTLNAGSSVTPICSSVIKSECHNITNTTTYNNPNTQKGIKRPNESLEQQQICQTSVIISSAAPHPPSPSPAGSCQVVSPGSGKIVGGTSSQKSPPVEDQVQDGEEEEQEEGDFMDENETTFDYEPVLIEILNEKKLALSNSPDVIKFLAGFRELHHKQTH